MSWYTSAQVAKQLQHTLGWFRENRRALEAKGFPKPDDAIVGHPRWIAAEVDAFCSARTRSAVAPAADLEAAGAQLDANARRLARPEQLQ